jgi:16S rRNA (uracil1498-N3)-methyltransferase
MRDPDHFLFFADKIDGATAFFPQAEWRHAVKVLRVGPDTPFQATDGSGRIFTCRGLTADYADGAAQITATALTKAPAPRLSLFIGLPERDSFERILDEAVPLGVACIVPMACARCQDRWWAPKWDKIALRMHNVMVSALKQSRNPWMPELAMPIPFAKAVERLDATALLADQEAQSFQPDSIRGASAVSCIIGPPGGFSESERQLLTEKNVLRVSLGAFRLRTELAATALTVLVSGGVSGHGRG